MFFSQREYPEYLNQPVGNPSNIGRATYAMNLVSELSKIQNVKLIEMTWRELNTEVLPVVKVEFFNSPIEDGDVGST